MKKTKIAPIVIGGLVLLQVFSLYQIRNLRKDMRIYVDQAYNSLEERISQIYSNVNSKLEEDMSLVTTCHYEVGDFNMESLKVPIEFSLQPKKLSQDSQVFLRFGEEEVPMERKGDKFFLRREFEISDEIYPTIIIEDKGIREFEENINLRIYELREEVFPVLYPSTSTSSGYSMVEPYYYELEGELSLDNIIGSDSLYNFEDIKYIISIDDKEVKSYQLGPDPISITKIKEKFDLEEGQVVREKLQFKDDRGIIYEYLSNGYRAGQEYEWGFLADNERIIAPDGRLIYERSEDF